MQGGLLAKLTQSMTAVDDRTFSIVLKEPFGLMLKTLAKSASVPLFVMPKRVAELPISQQIADTTGSGPFIFKKDEWKPGEKVVYVRNPDYKPRAEPPSSLAGGKVAKLDRVEWISIPDGQTAVNALMPGEIDMIESLAHDLLPVLEKDKNIEIRVPDLRQHLRAALQLEAAAVRQPQGPPRRRVRAEPARLPEGHIGDPRYFKECRAMFGCGATFETAAGSEGILQSNFEELKKLLKEAGYDGKPIVVLQTTDINTHVNLAPVAKSLLEKGGFKVDVQSMDWQTQVTRRAKKDPVDKGGWNISMTAAATVLLSDPIVNHYTEATGDRAQFGWPLDEEIEKLRMDSPARAIPRSSSSSPRRSRSACSTSASPCRSASSCSPGARNDRHGNVPSPVTVFWNIEKK